MGETESVSQLHYNKRDMFKKVFKVIFLIIIIIMTFETMYTVAWVRISDLFLSYEFLIQSLSVAIQEAMP